MPGRWRWTRGWRGRGWWEAAHDRHLILVDDGHRDVQLERVVLRVSRPAHKANVRHLHKLCRDRAVGLLRHRQHLLPVVQDELQQPPLEPGGLRGRPQLVIEELEPLVRKPVALQPRRDEALLAKRHVLMRPEAQPLHGAQRHLPAQVLDRQRPGYAPRWQVTHPAAAAGSKVAARLAAARTPGGRRCTGHFRLNGPLLYTTSTRSPRRATSSSRRYASPRGGPHPVQRGGRRRRAEGPPVQGKDQTRE